MRHRRPIDGGLSPRKPHGFRTAPEYHLPPFHKIQLHLVMLIRRIHGVWLAASAMEAEGNGVNFRRCPGPLHKNVRIRKKIPM